MNQFLPLIFLLWRLPLIVLAVLQLLLKYFLKLIFISALFIAASTFVAAVFILAVLWLVKCYDYIKKYIAATA